ncbi:MAG: ABC transporter ATP-binding protein [Burkholderiaceae bacterium]
MSKPPIISAQALSRRYGQVAAVDNVSFDIQENEFFSLLGPSGCGKTTLLRMIAGLETPSAGELHIAGEDMSERPANERPVNMVFQSYAVFPHMSVADNVAYGLKVTGTPASEIKPRVTQALESVRLDQMASRKPNQLSGGQRQRVALARALVKRPRVLLLDEPMSALDAKLREQMQWELTSLQKAVGITFVMVTHDQQEALSMSDRIAVMDHGRIAQLDTPRQLYEEPANRFVADFIGRINLIKPSYVDHSPNGAMVGITDGGQLLVQAAAPDGEVSLAIRPEHIMLHQEPVAVTADNAAVSLQARVVQQAFMGDSSQITVESMAGDRLTITQRRENTEPNSPLNIGDSVYAMWQAAHCRLLANDDSE